MKKKLTDEQVRAAKKLKAIYTAKKPELKLSQDVIAKKMKVTQGLIYQFLNAKTALHIKAVFALAKILQVPSASIYPELVSQHQEDLEATGDKTNPAGGLISNPTNELTRLIKNWNEMPDESRALLLATSEVMVREAAKTNKGANQEA